MNIYCWYMEEIQPNWDINPPYYIHTLYRRHPRLLYYISWPLLYRQGHPSLLSYRSWPSLHSEGHPSLLSYRSWPSLHSEGHPRLSYRSWPLQHRRVEWFWIQFFTHIGPCCAKLFKNPKSKIHVLLLLLNLTQGLRNVWVELQYPKNLRNCLSKNVFSLFYSNKKI